MKVEDYNNELEIIMEELRKAHKSNNSSTISKYTTLLNELWEKGNDIRLKAMAKDGFTPPPTK
jgi:hypothetical protein